MSRVGRAFAGGRWQRAMTPFGPGSIFTRNNEAAPRSASQIVARKMANQLNYSNPNYSYDGKAAPSFYGYEGEGLTGAKYGFQINASATEFTPSLLEVPAGLATQKVTYVNYLTKEPRPKGAANNLQSFFEAVPVPPVSAFPAGSFVPGGTDKAVCIWRPSTDEMWETWKWEGVEGAYTFGYGGYIPEVSKSNGIFTVGAEGAWGSRACGLYLIGGMITMQDMVEVLRGGKIKHALAMSIPVTANSTTPPATRHDSMASIPKEFEGKLNPAYPNLDAVAEAAWFCFPPGSKASEFGINEATELLATAVFNAIREYGVTVVDSSGTNCLFYIELANSLGSPYSYAKVNPFPGQSFTSFVPSSGPGSWTDPSLDAFTEQIHGLSSVWIKQPWKELQVLEPFAS